MFFRCDVCDLICQRETDLKVHQLQQHLNPFYLSPDDRKVGKVNVNRVIWIPLMTCPFLYQVDDFSVQSSWEPDDENLSGLFRCNLCFTLYDLKKELKAHLAHHQNDQEGQKQIRENNPHSMTNGHDKLVNGHVHEDNQDETDLEEIEHQNGDEKEAKVEEKVEIIGDASEENEIESHDEEKEGSEENIKVSEQAESSKVSEHSENSNVDEDAKEIEAQVKDDQSLEQTVQEQSSKTENDSKANGDNVQVKEIYLNNIGESVKRKSRKKTLSQNVESSNKSQEEESAKEVPAQDVELSSEVRSSRPERRCKSTCNTLVAINLADENLELNFESDEETEVESDEVSKVESGKIILRCLISFGSYSLICFQMTTINL